MDKARNTALLTLVDIDKNGAYSNIAIKRALDNHNERDRYFITNLVYGVTDKRLTLDYAIEQYSKIKLKKISVYILNILRLGIYQLLFMDKIPPPAAINESVTLAKRYGHKASAGFVNGVLRNILRNGIKYPKDKREYLSVKYSYPMRLVDMWISDFGYEFSVELMEAYSKSPRLTLRANTLKITPQDLAKELKAYNAEVNGAALICDGFDIAKNELYINGYFTVQDISAMQPAILLSPQKGDTVIDMCAAPGGKTTHMAELMENEGEILAFDIYPHKTELIKKNAERLGIGIIKTRVTDASELNNELIASADKVLCDVPCSGLGIIGRKPEIKWNVQEDLSGLYSTQLKILKNAARYIKPDGDIVYSTCTINKRENEDITDKFILENTEFIKAYEKTFYPHIDGSDGFYICKLTRNKNA